MAGISDTALQASSLARIVEACGLTFAKRVLDEYEGRPDSSILKRAQLYLDAISFYEILYGQDHDKSAFISGLERLCSTFAR